MAECILISIIRSPYERMRAHAPDDRDRTRNKYHLHHGIIDRDEIREEIQVPRQKYYCVQLLRLQRDS